MFSCGWASVPNGRFSIQVNWRLASDFLCIKKSLGKSLQP